MKAVILAAGRGTRLEPITEDIPKCLVRVGGVPIVDRMIARLAEAGINQLVVVTGHRGTVLQNHLASSELDLARNAEIIFNDRFAEWGNFYSLLAAEEALRGSDFVKLDSDVLLGQDVLLRLLAADGPAVLCVDGSVKLGSEEMKVRLDERGRAVELNKHIPAAAATGESIGVDRIDASLSPTLFAELRTMIDDGETDEYYERAYERLMKKGIAFDCADISDCTWCEIDDVDDLARAEEIVAANPGHAFAHAAVPQQADGDSSPAPWALVDARATSDAEIAATTRLAGLSLAARQVRMAASQGWLGAVVQVDDDAKRRDIATAIAAHPPRAGFAIEYAVAAAEPPNGRAYVPMRATEIYTAAALASAAESGEAPEPLTRIEHPSDVREVERRLARLSRKNVDQDGVVSYFAFRPMSRLMTRALLNTRVTPNQVSAVALLLGVAATICAAFGGYYPVLAAGLLYWVGAVVDCVDGEIARLRIERSKLGEWLDTLADDVSTYGLLAGLGIGLALDGYDNLWAVVGIGGAAVGFLLQAKIYADLHRWGMTIDTAQYPWFFGAPSEGEGAKRGFVGRVFYICGFFFRRDAFVTIIAILLALDLRPLATAALAAGVAVTLLLFVVHIIVTTIWRGYPERAGDRAHLPAGYFGVKDIFTIINLLGGVVGMYFAFEGNLEYAGYSIFAGYVFGDALDGPIARWTKTSNRFGGEFDAATDHLAQAVSPAVMVYVAFKLGDHEIMGLGVMAALITTASIRQARLQVASFNYPLTYCGLPRTVSGLICISLPNSTIFFKYSVIPYEGLAALLVVVGILNLCPIPYMTHKGRKFQWWVRPFVVAFFAVPFALFFAAPQFLYDFLFVTTFGYALTAWIPLLPEERRAFWAEYKRWSRAVAASK